MPSLAMHCPGDGLVGLFEMSNQLFVALEEGLLAQGSWVQGSQLIGVGEANEGPLLRPLNVAGSVTPLKYPLLIGHLSFPGNFASFCTIQGVGKPNHGIQQNACEERVNLLSE